MIDPGQKSVQATGSREDLLMNFSSSSSLLISDQSDVVIQLLVPS